MIGKVVDICIPNQYRDGILLDVMDRSNILFKIMIDNNIREVILQIDDNNSKIMKNDSVKIIEIDNHIVDIKLYGGSLDE